MAIKELQRGVGNDEGGEGERASWRGIVKEEVVVVKDDEAGI